MVLISVWCFLNVTPRYASIYLKIKSFENVISKKWKIKFSISQNLMELQSSTFFWWYSGIKFLYNVCERF